MLICTLCLNAACVVVCLRQVSALTSQRNRLRQAIESVESFESRIDELRQKVNSISRKYALEDRRDPETGKSRVRDDDSDPYNRKAALRRKLGLSGMSHVEIARRAMRPTE
jgi:hypothetical protein